MTESVAAARRIFMLMTWSAMSHGDVFPRDRECGS